MKKAVTNASALGALTASLATIGCCLPPAIAGAAGFAALAALPTALQPWLLLISLGLLLVGVVTAYRGVRCGMKPSKWNWILLSLAGVVLIVTALFPQLIAGFVADYLFRGRS